jgi:predicted DNA repair protein MutK
VWSVAKGSFKNKLILVPAALAISALAPWAVTPLLMLGGAFLCYEGFEKVAHKLMPAHGEQTHRTRLVAALADPTVDMVAFEKDKIKGRRAHRFHPVRRDHRHLRSAPWQRRRSGRRSRY